VELDLARASAVGGCFELVPVNDLPSSASSRNLQSAAGRPPAASPIVPPELRALGGAVYAADGPVRLNGLELTPPPGADPACGGKPCRIVIDNRLDWVYCPKVPVRIHGSPFTLVRDGELSRTLQGTDRARLADFRVPSGLPKLFGFELEGSAEIDLARGGGSSGLPRYSTVATVHTKLPPLLGSFEAVLRLLAPGPRALPPPPPPPTPP